jgi:small-conductance mechanosensitive channel
MPDFQSLIAILTVLLVFLTGVFLSYDTLQFRNYQFSIPQWSGLLLAAITFCLVALDQLLQGFVRVEEQYQRVEEQQRRLEEQQQRVEERNRRLEEQQQRVEERNRRIEERNRSLETAERETRRTRIETRYRTAIIRFQLEPNNLHRQQLTDILALLDEYRDTL